MTIYEILFVDGSSYILAADEMDNGEHSIRFFQYSKNRDGTLDLVARFKRSEVRGWVIKEELNGGIL